MIESRKMRGRIVAAALAMAMGAVPAAAADEAPSARNGLRLVHEWCSTCHSIEGVETDPDRAPTYTTIVERDGRTRAYFTRFLNEDHFPMPTYRLYDSEKADVVEFLMWLKEG